MSNMFWLCARLNELNVSHFKTQNVTDMACMFADCDNLLSLDLNNFDTSNVTDMSQMFEGCSRLVTLYLSKLNTQNSTHMNSMFSGLESLLSFNITCYTRWVVSMTLMFEYWKSLSYLTIKNFSTKSLGSILWFAKGCRSLQIL